MLIVGVLFATVVLRVGLVAAAVYLLLPRAPACPRCRERTVSVRYAVLDGLAWLVGERLCLACGWSGVMRSPVTRPVRSPGATASRADRNADPRRVP